MKVADFMSIGTTYTFFLLVIFHIVAGATKPRISQMLNVQESRKKHGCFNTIMNGTDLFLPCHSGSIFFSIKICNLDRTKSTFLATSLYKKVIFTKNWVTTCRSCHPSDHIDIHCVFSVETYLCMYWLQYTLLYYVIIFLWNCISQHYHGPIMMNLLLGQQKQDSALILQKCGIYTEAWFRR